MGESAAGCRRSAMLAGMDSRYLAELPDERDHPEKMELWVALHGTPGPSGFDGDLDDRFRYAGMVWRGGLNVHAVVAEAVRRAPLGAVRAARPQPVRMNLSWEVVPPWLGYVLPPGPLRRWGAVSLAALVLQTPAQGVRGYAGRVECGSFTPDLDSGATLPVEATYDDSDATVQWWYRLPAEVSA